MARHVFAPEPDAALSLQSLHPQMSTLRKVFSWVGQEEPTDCALAALAMVARYHGLADVSVASLRQAAAPGVQGLTLLQLQNLGESLGLRCLAVRVNPGQIGAATLPAIAHCHGEHYVVVYEHQESGIVIGDPASGIVRISSDQFAQTCTGNLLLIRSPTRPGRG